MGLEGIRAALEERRRRLKDRLREAGEEAVRTAVETGDYHDRTGRLRASNRYEVEGDDLILSNDAPYAARVEAMGYNVLTHAALEAERFLQC